MEELLGAEARGHGPDGFTAVAPHDRDLVSWPESAGSASLLEVLLEPGRQGAIDGQRSLLLRDEEVRPGDAKVH